MLEPMSGSGTLGQFRGCLLGGAVGDALGAPVEFLSLAQIRARFGPAGVTGYAPAYGRAGAITDDTQMTLFTAEALIRTHNRFLDRGIASVIDMGRYSYLRWLHTQDGGGAPQHLNGWLLEQAFLHSQRAPGNTCLSALRSGKVGTIKAPLNQSKGCGGVMRVAPVGLAAVSDHFQTGCELAALTHGHPSGYLAAGFFAQLVHLLVGGTALTGAIDACSRRLQKEPGHEETLLAVERAVTAAREADATPEQLERLGAGWVAEEALGLSLFCALKATDFRSGVLLAVNHSGDADSTGSMVGNLLGLLHGEGAIPSEWLTGLEGAEVIGQLAHDLWLHFGEARPGEERARDAMRYPPTA